MQRIAEIKRKTNETNIALALNIDGGDVTIDIDKELDFFEHMLTLFACHGGLGLNVKSRGDVNVDGHHSVEDIGICLGMALNEAIGDKKGINRYGFFLLPMDEALVEVALDFSGRSFLSFNVPFSVNKAGNFNLELVEEFFAALVRTAGLTLHVTLKAGKNNHHIAEAVFKGVARALKMAVAITSTELQSTKGTL